MIRWLAVLACALTVCITASSAFIRHSQAGLGCPGWPDAPCVAQTRAAHADALAAQAQPAAQEPGVRAARGLHRVSAMLVGVLVLLIAVFGWSSMGAGGRVALAFALVDTFFLAWLGRFTPHPVPLVTIGNLLGGIALAAAFAWIAASLRWPSRLGAKPAAAAPAPPATRATPSLLGASFVALALLAAAAWIGTMIGAHDAIAACEAAACSGSLRVEPGALDPLRAAQPVDAAAARGLHWLHRLVVAALAIVALIVAARARRSGAARAAVLLVVLLLAQAAAGIGTAIGVQPLATATLHNALATLLAVLLAALAARSLARRSDGGQESGVAARNAREARGDPERVGRTGAGVHAHPPVDER